MPEQQAYVPPSELDATIEQPVANSESDRGGILEHRHLPDEQYLSIEISSWKMEAAAKQKERDAFELDFIRSDKQVLIDLKGGLKHETIEQLEREIAELRSLSDRAQEALGAVQKGDYQKAIDYYRGRRVEIEEGMREPQTQLEIATDTLQRARRGGNRAEMDAAGGAVARMDAELRRLHQQQEAYGDRITQLKVSIDEHRRA